MKKQDMKMLETCLKYIETLQNRKFTTPYHYLTFKEGKDGVKQQGMINASELSAHVQTADKLGRETCVTTDGERVNISFVERFIPVPWEIRGAILKMNTPLQPQVVIGKIKKTRKGKK